MIAPKPGSELWSFLLKLFSRVGDVPNEAADRDTKHVP